MEQLDGYLVVASPVVNDYLKAKKHDMLPDESTALTMGMSGGQVGHTLYGAFNTLFMHGRISRTMLEQAMSYSPSSYPDFVQMWIRSLFPNERSGYAADLYNSNFSGITWDNQMYRNISTLMTGGDQSIRLEPPFPLGDNRHVGKCAQAVEIASEFYDLLNYGILFDGDAGDVHSKLDPSYVEAMDSDVLNKYGSLFGIDSSDLNWTLRSDSHSRRVSRSELILRSWNALYYSRRLCKTELENALMHGPERMSRLLRLGIHLTLQMFDSKGQPMAPVQSLDLLRQTQREGLTWRSNNNGRDHSSDQLFTELAEDPEKKCLQCDYCGDPLEKTLRCSRCKIAMYCKRDCQKGDWKRHKPLCEHYKTVIQHE